MHKAMCGFVNPGFRLLVATVTFALVTTGFVNADDAKTSATPAKQEATAAADKKAKDDVSKSASKCDLSTPASKLNFYGIAEAGVSTSSFKDACSNKTVRANESYYRMTLGTDVKLTEDISLGVQVSSARGTVHFH